MPVTADTILTKYVLDSSGYEAGANRVQKATRSTAGSFNSLRSFASGGSNPFSALADGANLAVRELDSATPIIQEVVSVLKTLAISAIAAGTAIAGFSLYAMHQAAELEALKMGLRAYAGSIEIADKNLRRLREVAKLPGLGFSEAIEGSTRLQAVGFNARLAERALLAFGNALALVGGGKAELDGVILALSQIVSKGQISAEEINQIAERVPQIRQAMIGAFGTANTEAITKSGVGPQEFVMRIIDALEKLPKAIGGSKNAFENFGDVFARIVTDIGDELNKFLIPAFNKVSDFLDNLADGGVFSNIAQNFLSLGKAGSPLSEMFGQIAKTVEFLSQGSMMGLDKILNFMSKSTDMGDGLMRVTSLVIAGFEQIPKLLDLGFRIIQTNMAGIQLFVNGIIDTVNGLITMLNKGISVKIFGIEALTLGGTGNGNEAIPLLKKGGEAGGIGFGLTPGQQAELGGIGGGMASRAEELYKLGQQKKPGEVMGDPTKGGFYTVEETLKKISDDTDEIAKNTSPFTNTTGIVGGGDLARQGYSMTDRKRAAMKGADAEISKVLEALQDWGDALSSRVLYNLESAR